MADRWPWAYALFRFADGASHSLLPLLPIIHYGLPIWSAAATAAAMNLAAVPASFAWGRIMQDGRGRRRLATAGFLLAAVSLAALALLPSFWWYVVWAMAFTVFGVSTGPAAAVLVLEGADRSQWGRRTARLSRLTGWAYLLGSLATIALAVAGELHAQALFGSLAIVAAAAALLAWKTIAAFAGVPAPRRGFDMDAMRGMQRRFERLVFWPGRLRHAPGRGTISRASRELRTLALGFVFLFAGSSLVLSSYPGVLAGLLGFPAAVVLLALMPSQFTSPLSYAWAGAYGHRHGEAQALDTGVLLRLVSLPGLALAVLWMGSGGLLLLLAFHAVLGVSFALLQVHGPCRMAELHEGGPGHGVGLYHAAVGGGVLLGAIAATGVLLVASLWVSYVVAVAALALGAAAIGKALASPPTITPINDASS